MHQLPPDDPSRTECERQRRQYDEICAVISTGLLHHAADLAHEHLAEFPDDHAVRSVVLDALDRSTDERHRRRRSEF
jgi:hypothetical protein